MGFHTEPIFFADAPDGEGFRDHDSVAEAAEIIEAVKNGNFQILDGWRGRRSIIVETARAYHQGNEGTRYETEWTPRTFAIAVGLGVDYVVVKPEGSGRDDLTEKMKAAQQLSDRLRWDAEQDPEGSFGGRGNNFLP